MEKWTSVYATFTGSDVVVYKNFRTPIQESFVVTGTREEDRFKLSPTANIAKGDVLQQKGSSVEWEVIDIDEYVFNNTLMHIEAKVRKFD